jgi:hypothetical protein
MSSTADSLLTTVRRKARLPQGRLTDAQILAVADETMSGIMVPYVRRFQEEYFVHSEDQSIVADQGNYRVPRRAQLASTRNVVYTDASGNETPLTEVGPVKAPLSRSAGNPSSRIPYGYYLQNGELWLVPTPSVAVGTLTVSYFRRPGKLVKEASSSNDVAASGAAVASVSGTAFICDYVPTGWANADIVCWIQDHSGFDSLIDDVVLSNTATGASGGFNLSAVPSVLIASDDRADTYINRREESTPIMLPEDTHPLFYTAVTAEVLSEIGRKDDAAKFLEDLSRKMGNMARSLENRNRGSSPRVFSWNSTLRHLGR